MILAAALLGWLFPAAPAAAHPLEVVPSDHRAYQTLYRLASWGLAPLWAASARPLSRIELAGMVAWGLERLAEERKRGINRPTSALEELEGLVLEFADELNLLGYRVIDPPMAPSARSITGWGVRFDRALVARVEAGTLPRGERSRGSGVYLEGRGTMGFGPGLVVGAEAKLGFRWGEDPWNGLRRVYLGGPVMPERPGNALVQLGRDSLWWGPGHRGAFMLSDNAGPMEFLRASVTRGNLRFEKIAGLVGDGLTLHAIRVDWLARDNLRIGAGETVIEQKGVWWPYLLSPFPGVSSALGPWLRGKNMGVDNNYNISLDFDWRIRPGLIAYGELFVDDLTYYPIYPLPNRGGALVGLFMPGAFGGRADLRFEHSRVNNWTYATSDGKTNYVRGGRSLGHWCAPDCELWSVAAVARTGSDARLEVGYDLVRKGEGKLGEFWSDGSEAWQKLYLWGVIETTNVARLTYGWGRTNGLDQSLTVGYASVTNVGHVAGQSRGDWFLRWEARYGF